MTTRTYDGPEHESLRAALRCLMVHRGVEMAKVQFNGLMRQLKVTDHSELSPWGANFARKHIEKQLPLRGDYV